MLKLSSAANTALLWYCERYRCAESCTYVATSDVMLRDWCVRYVAFVCWGAAMWRFHGASVLVLECPCSYCKWLFCNFDLCGCELWLFGRQCWEPSMRLLWCQCAAEDGELPMDSQIATGAASKRHPKGASESIRIDVRLRGSQQHMRTCTFLIILRSVFSPAPKMSFETLNVHKLACIASRHIEL